MAYAREEQAPGMDLAPTSSATLFHTDDPLTVLAIAKAMAEPLADLIKANGLTTRISGKDHVQLEGWQALGSMLGVSAHTVWSQQTDIDGGGWEARAEARTTDGRVVGAAEAMCTRGEKRGGKMFWRNSPEYALRSMAQTRAQSKALAGPLRWVMAMTGTDGAPAEEMADVEVVVEKLPAWAEGTDPVEFVKSLETLLGALGTDLDVHAAANSFGRRVYERCDNTIPIIAADVVALLLQALMPDADLGEHEGGDGPTPTEAPPGRSVVDAEFDTVYVDPDNPAHEVTADDGTGPADPDTTTPED